MEPVLPWTKVGEFGAAGVSAEEYLDASGKFCKQVWNDGYEEVFEVEEKSKILSKRGLQILPNML